MAFTQQGYVILHVAPKYDLVTILSGVGAMFVYLLIRVAAIARIKVYEKETRWDFLLNNLKFMRILTLLTFVMCVIIFFLIPRSIQLILLIPGTISLLYGIPVRYKGKLFRLRDVGVAKIFMIAFVWAFIGSMLPAANAGMSIFGTATLLLFAANFLFTFAITLPFDIKDLKIDALHNVKTIPLKLGVENTYSLAYLCLFISGIIHVFLQREILTGIDYAIPLTISILITGWSIFLTSKKQDQIVYFGILDGMLILQFVLLAFAPIN